MVFSGHTVFFMLCAMAVKWVSVLHLAFLYHITRLVANIPPSSL